MSIVNEITGASQVQQTRKTSSQLDQEDFMKLLVAQMENQDPTKPMDNFQFLSQIAQFGMVDGIQNLGTSFDSVASNFRQNMVMEATSMLGRKVMASGGHAELMSGDIVEGNIQVEGGASNVVIEVRTPEGQLVYGQTFAGNIQGEIPFGWAGVDAEGNRLPDGAYVVTARGEVGGKVQQLEVETLQRVESVTLGANGAIELALISGEVIEAVDITQVR